MCQRLRNESYPRSCPSVTQNIKCVTDTVTKVWYGNANIYGEGFEKAFVDYFGGRYAFALPSCTSAIHLSLPTLCFGPGNEVIVPDAKWIATSEPISHIGTPPVFAEIDPVILVRSAVSFEAYITSQTEL